MIIKFIVNILSAIMGTWLIFDGIYVLKHGKYYLGEKTGPWSCVVSSFGINPFKMGYFFVFLRVLWFLFIIFKNLNMELGNYLLLIVPLLSIWYFPFGSIISIIVLASVLAG